MSASPYASAGANLREMGYSVMPVGPGTKWPGRWNGSAWDALPGWQKYCDAPAPEFIHDKWETWPDAGVCIAHGDVIGLDLDTDREDVAEALREAVPWPDVRRRGQKGWMGYYRRGSGLDDMTARVRWYDPKVKNADGKPSRSPVVELLLHGTQSVLPPTIHPGTGRPYQWLTGDSLESVEPEELDEFTGDHFAALDAAMSAIGLTRDLPRDAREYTPIETGGADLEKPFGRSLNDRAMEAIDQWWPALDLPKSRQRGPGAWEGVAFWRASGSGRAIQDRNPNLRAISSGIRDFGDDRSYTPVDVVMTARDCSVSQAMEWLGGFVRPEEGLSAADVLETVREMEVAKATPAGPVDGAAVRSASSRFKDRSCGRDKVKPVPPVSVAEFRDTFPQEVPPFPVQDFEADLGGLLREMTQLIDEAANMRSEQGAFGAALACLSVLMGRMVEVSQTSLRTNLYIIGTADSGAGKSSAMSAMSGIMGLCGISDRLGGSDFTSGAAILKEMNARLPQLFNVDEFGDVIRRALAPKAASHERDIGRILKDMYSSAGGIYRGKAYATQERKDISDPHMCLYGVSTHEAFWESIDGRSFNDGLLARFVMIPIGATETQTPSRERLETVKEMVTGLIHHSKGSGNMADVMPSCRAVEFAPGVWDAWMRDRAMFQRHAERARLMRLPGAPSIILRICENAMKVAMISALGKRFHAPTIEADDYDLGMDVAHWSAIYMLNAIEQYYVENTSHRDLKRVQEFIEMAGPEGRTKREIVQRFRGIFVGPGARAIVDTMLESGDVVIVKARLGESHKSTSFFVATVRYADFCDRHGLNPENPSEKPSG